MKRQAGDTAGPLAVEGVVGGVPIPISGSISGGNAAASATGAAVPADADFQGVNVGGTLRGVTGVNPTGSVFAEQVDLASLGGTALSGTLPISGTVTATGPLTDTQLRATAVPVSGPLTDTQLRATAVPVSGPLTDTQLRATAVPVSGPLTDTQLRATAVPISGTVTATVSTAALTASSPAVASVGVASAQAVAANASRKGLVLVNLSSSNISFGIGATAVLGSGITLVPNGVWEMDQFTLSVAAINAIAGAASSSLSVQEFA